MSDLGLLHYFLEIEISQIKNVIFISQRKYTKNILKNFNLSGCKHSIDLNEKLKKDDEAKKDDVAKVLLKVFCI